MEAILSLSILAAIVWGLVYVWRGSLLAGCVATLLVGYICSHHFWRLELGPITLTAARVMIAGLIGVLVWRWRQGLVSFRPLTGADWLAGLFVGYVGLRYLTTAYPENVEPSVSPLWRAIECFGVPLALHAVARTVEFGERGWKVLLLALSCLGVYLGATALAEIAQAWWAVFPKYIADFELGTHFGRARGPALNSVSLGLYLTVCFWASWLLWPRVGRPGRLVLAVAMALMCGALYFTYTRSAWLALAATLAVLPLIHLPRSWKPVFLGGLLVAGACATALVGGRLLDMHRDDADGSAIHSVYQRQTFLVVSMRMFADHPLVGCGFGRFYDKKLPYLADRSQQLELESIRDLDHHNTFLSILTETGLVGLSLFIGLLVAWGRTAWQMCRDKNAPAWLQTQGLLTLAVLLIYAINAVFHDLTLLPNQQWLLFVFAGVSVGWYGKWRVGAVTSVQSGSELSYQPMLNLGLNWKLPLACTEPAKKEPAGKVRLFGISLDRVTMTQAVETLWQWTHGERTAECRYVVTPNVDHVVMYQTNERLRLAYHRASLVLADGAPVVLAARLLGKRLPERVAGSDLVPALFDRAESRPQERSLRVFLLGGAPGVATRAARNIHQRWTQVEVVGTLAPPLGFENDPQENQRIIDAVAQAQPDVVLIGLGAPKQEFWIHRHADKLATPVALCVGATIDFLAGEKQRCPRWMSQLGLEWCHRLASEPARLGRRYLRDAWIFPQLLWRELGAKGS